MSLRVCDALLSSRRCSSASILTNILTAQPPGAHLARFCQTSAEYNLTSPLFTVLDQRLDSLETDSGNLEVSVCACMVCTRCLRMSSLSNVYHTDILVALLFLRYFTQKKVRDWCGGCDNLYIKLSRSRIAQSVGLSLLLAVPLACPLTAVGRSIWLDIIPMPSQDNHLWVHNVQKTEIWGVVFRLETTPRTALSR